MNPDSLSKSSNATLLSPKHLYFPNLNGVRFIAAFSVLFHHIEQVKTAFNIENIYHNPIINHAGKQGVGLFFVLSGFLITYLLLNEKSRFQKINIKDFYVRRILRIWPIYFIIIILATVVFPNIPIMHEVSGDTKYNDSHFYPRLSLLLLVLPNLSFVLYDLPYMCSQTWSIGVEEQFYYIWPWLVNADNWKKRGIVIVIFLTALLSVAAFYFYFFTDYNTSDIPKLVLFFLSQFRITMMVVGAFGAYLVFKKHPILKTLYRKDVQYLTYGILLIIIIFSIEFKGLNLEIYSLFFCYFIVNVASNPNTIINLEQPIISYLGKISYGIYIYHIAVTVLVVNLMSYFQRDLSIFSYNFVLYLSTTGLTVLIAGLSYRFLESRFLLLKERFSR